MTTNVLRENVWRYLPIEKLMQLCQTDRSWRKFCQQPHIWRFLIQRDFDVYYPGDDAYQVYRNGYRNLNRKSGHKIYNDIIINLSDLNPQQLIAIFTYNWNNQKRIQPLLTYLNGNYTMLSTILDGNDTPIEMKQTDLFEPILVYGYRVNDYEFHLIPKPNDKISITVYYRTFKPKLFTHLLVEEEVDIKTIPEIFEFFEQHTAGALYRYCQNEEQLGEKLNIKEISLLCGRMNAVVYRNRNDNGTYFSETPQIDI